MNTTQETLDLMKQALANAQVVNKAWTQPSTATSGLNYYDLEAPSKKLFPVLSPLRNIIPRVGGGAGTAVNWRSVDAINTANITPGVSEGNRGAVVTTTTTDHTTAYSGIGLEDSVTFEAEYAGQNFEDVRAMAVENLLSALMIEEERLILGGNGSSAAALGTTPKPVGTKVAGGSMTAQATVAYCVALTLEGYRQSSVTDGVAITSSRTRAGVAGGTDTVNLGQAKISAESDAVTTETTNLSITWTVTAVKGAVAYAWFTGTTGASNCTLAAITTVNEFKQTADAAGTQLANATGLSTDHSADSLVFDGLISQLSLGGYFKSLDGAGFTSDGAAGITEIDAMLQDRYDNKRLGISDIFFSSQDIQNVSKKIIGPSGTPAFRLEVAEGGRAQMTGGGMVPAYFNKFTGETVNFHIHPYLPPGTAIGFTQRLPYRLNGVPNVIQIRTRQEYRAMDWPMTSRKYEFGVYADEQMQVYFPGAGVVFANIGNA